VFVCINVIPEIYKNHHQTIAGTSAPHCFLHNKQLFWT